MQIFKEFGVNPILLVAQIVNFLIILVVLKRFLYKPVLSMLKKREEEIESGVKNALAAQEKLTEAEEKEREILQKAQASADKLLSEAKAEAAELRAKMEESAKRDSEKILLEAREQIDQETKAAEEKLTQNIGQIAVALLEKSLTGIFGEKEQKAILKKAVMHIESGKH